MPEARNQVEADTLAMLGLAHRRTVHDVLDIDFEEASPDRVVVSAPVTWKVQQPAGLLHGGVSALLAESAASIGGALNAPPGHSVVGIELGCSHLRAVTGGRVSAVATPIRIGRTVQVWDVTISDERDRPVAKARVSLAVVNRGGEAQRVPDGGEAQREPDGGEAQS